MNRARLYQSVTLNPEHLFDEYIFSHRINLNCDEDYVHRMRDFGDVIKGYKNSYSLVASEQSISQEIYDKTHAALNLIDRYNLLTDYYIRLDQYRNQAKQSLCKSVNTIHDIFKISSGFFDRQSAEQSLRHIERRFEDGTFIEQMRHCREDLERVFIRLMDNTIQGKALPDYIDRDMETCKQFLQSVPEIITAINDNLSILSGRKPA